MYSESKISEYDVDDDSDIRYRGDVRTDTVIVVKEDNLEMKEIGSGTMICPGLI